MTSTPTASSERTRLCAPVMPVAGSAAASATDRAAVSTPARAAAASRVAVSRGRPPGGRAAGGVAGGVLARGGGHRGVLLGLADRGGSAVGRGQQKTPRATGTEGSARRSWTDALGDYEAREQSAEQAGARHLHTVRLDGATRQPACPTRWTGDVHFRHRAAEQRRVEAVEEGAQVAIGIGRPDEPALHEAGSRMSPQRRAADRPSPRPRRRRPCRGVRPRSTTAAHQGRRARVGLDVADELAVHLQHVDRQPGEVGQRRVAACRSRPATMMQPISRRVPRSLSSRSSASISTDSVTSIISRCGGSPRAARARATSGARQPACRWRTETLTPSLRSRPSTIRRGEVGRRPSAAPTAAAARSGRPPRRAR